jgi:hypothetical protein
LACAPKKIEKVWRTTIPVGIVTWNSLPKCEFQLGLFCYCPLPIAINWRKKKEKKKLILWKNGHWGTLWIKVVFLKPTPMNHRHWKYIFGFPTINREIKYFLIFFDIKLIYKINQIENQNAQFENYEKPPQKRYIVLQWLFYIGFTTLANCKNDFILSFQFTKGSFITTTITKGVLIHQMIFTRF